ncbi:MAG: DUF3887 domain-containing protein [Acidobacteria bacterium]|nr:MAG: DUF3887 domain-containing protein [Acidobacteriota bacterium]
METWFRRSGTVAAVIFLFFASAFAQAPDYAHIAKQAVTNLASANYDAVEQAMKPEMAQEVPGQILQLVWMHVVRRFGAFQQITGVTSKPVKEQQLVEVACQFAHGPVTVEWIINAQGQITGLHFQ